MVLRRFYAGFLRALRRLYGICVYVGLFPREELYGGAYEFPGR